MIWQKTPKYLKKKQEKLNYKSLKQIFRNSTNSEITRRTFWKPSIHQPLLTQRALHSQLPRGTRCTGQQPIANLRGHISHCSRSAREEHRAGALDKTREDGKNGMFKNIHWPFKCWLFEIWHLPYFECWFFDISFPTIVPFQCWYFENYHLRSTLW